MQRFAQRAPWARVARTHGAGSHIEVPHELMWYGGPALSLAAEHVAIAGRDNTARIWHLTAGTERARAAFNSELMVVALSPDGRYLAVSVYRGEDMDEDGLEAARTRGIWLVRNWDDTSASRSGNATT